MFAIIRNEARSFYRDGLAVFFSLIFPSLLVFLLGTLLENVDKSDETVGAINVSYCVSESGAAVESFIESLSDEEIIIAEKCENTDTFAAKIENGEICAAIYENGGKVTVYTGNNEEKSRAVCALFDGYSVTADAYSAAASVNPAALSGFSVPDKAMTVCGGLSKQSMLDYYAVSMLIMILFVGSVVCSASSYHRERKNLTMNRIDIAPIGAGKVYLGKVLGSLVSGAVQSGVVMLTSVLLFGAHYCSTLGGNLLLILMLFCTLLAVNGLGMMLGLFFKKISLTPILLGVFWLLLFFSGVYSRGIYIKGLSELIPVYQVQQAAFDLTLFGRGDRALSVIAVSLGLVALFVAASAAKVKLGRKAV